MNCRVYLESDLHNTVLSKLFAVNCPFRILDIRVQKVSMKSSCVCVCVVCMCMCVCGGGARGAYLAHGLYIS